jgi:glycosyltransferase involved in cell wall biosynthesis
MKGMRILLVPDPTSPNGEDAFCREIARRAPARGHEAALQAVPNGPLDETLDRLSATGFALESDVVLVNSLQPAALLAARAAGKKTAVRLIDSFAEASAQALEKVRPLALQADLLLVPSQYLASLIKAWGGNGQIRLIPYAYDRINAQQIALVTVRASRAHGMDIIAASPLNEATRPGFETLLSAMARLRLDGHLSIVGVGPALEALKARAQQLLLADRVTFLGHLPHPKLMEFMRSAKAFVDPCGVEGFPTLALHSLSEGCPVVAARTPSVEELIRDGENGLLFRPGDPLALSEQLTTLWSVRGLSLKLIDEGIKTVASMSWDSTAGKTLDALEGI